MIKAFRDQWLDDYYFVGAMLKEEFLAPLGITQGELAKSMGVGRKTINELCPRVPARSANRFMDPPVTLAAILGAATPEPGRLDKPEAVIVVAIRRPVPVAVRTTV